MTNYCRSNVRRVINYTNTEPVNKYDLWLSENLRYNEDGELVYDSPGQPACDLILKLFVNGHWEPIVGYNTTAGNKINIVKDELYTYIHDGVSHTSNSFQQFHLPLFRDPEDSPFELFDSGTIGEAMNEFITAAEWQQIFNNPNFYNTWNNNTPNIEPRIPVADYNVIGGINAQVDSVASDYRGLPVLRGGPNCGLTYGDDVPSGFTLYGDSLTYNPDNTFLYIPGWALRSWLNDPTGNGTPLPFPIDPGSIVIALDTVLKNTSSIGWRVITTSSNPSISPDIWGVDTGNAGKYLRIKQLTEWPTIPPGETAPTGGWNQSNNVMEWVDLPTATQYSGINLIKVDSVNSQIGIDITTNVPTDGSFIIYDSGEVKWSNAPITAYTHGKGIDITSGVISQDITYFESEHSDTVYTVQIDQANARDTFQITYDNSDTETVDIYQVFDFGDVTLNSSIDYSITQMPRWANPVYFILRNVKNVSLANNQETINMPAGFSGEDYLVTIQFGIVKFEEIEVTSI